MSELILSSGGIAIFVVPIVILAMFVFFFSPVAGTVIVLMLIPIIPVGLAINSHMKIERRALAENYIQDTMSRYACLDDVEGFVDDGNALRVKESGKNYKIITLEKKSGFPNGVTFTIKDDYSYTVHGFY